MAFWSGLKALSDRAYGVEWSGMLLGAIAGVAGTLAVSGHAVVAGIVFGVGETFGLWVHNIARKSLEAHQQQLLTDGKAEQLEQWDTRRIWENIEFWLKNPSAANNSVYFELTIFSPCPRPHALALQSSQVLISRDSESASTDFADLPLARVTFDGKTFYQTSTYRQNGPADVLQKLGEEDGKAQLTVVTKWAVEIGNTADNGNGEYRAGRSTWIALG